MSDHEAWTRANIRDEGTRAVGVKHDAGKSRWSLIPKGVLTAIVDILEFGARKYSADNWMIVPDARTRYYDAMQRHISAWWDGARLDPETGKLHLAHAACCLLYLIWFDLHDHPIEKTTTGNE